MPFCIKTNRINEKKFVVPKRNRDKSQIID